MDPSDLINSTYLWHLRLCHISLDRIKRLVRVGPLQASAIVSLPKRPFSDKGRRAIELLELVHSYVCGPLSQKARGGYEYFITFNDDYSRYGFVYFLKHKSETFNVFKVFRALMEKQNGKVIKTIRSDRGGEYMSGEFDDFLKEEGIASQLTAPGIPQQNRVSEIRNRTLEMVRSMISYSSLPLSF